MPRALVVADDLTGAMDTGHAFAARGYRTTVQVDLESQSPETTVLALNTDSRYADPGTAADRVRRAVETGNAPVVYKKVDSTLRGNIVSEVRSALACGFEYGLFAPASPAVGRLTANGYHLAEGRLLSDTEYADDPNGPTSDRLPSLVGAIERTSHLGVETVASGSESIRAAIADGPAGTLFTCDAIHERHLEAIARAGTEHAADRPLYAGSAGLAQHVEIPGEPDGEPRRITADGGVLGIVGSVSETSLEQLRAVPEEWTTTLDPEALVRDPERAGREAATWASERLAGGEHAVVTAAPDREAVDRTLAAGERAGLDAATVEARVGRALATVAAGAIRERGDRRGPAGLFVTGGDVARAVFAALGATTISLSGEAVESGIPVGRIDDGPAADIPVVTKAGGFGDRETAVNCLRALGEGNERDER